MPRLYPLSIFFSPPKPPYLFITPLYNQRNIIKPISVLSALINWHISYFLSEGLRTKLTLYLHLTKITLYLHLLVSLSLYVATLKAKLHRILWPDCMLHKENLNHLLWVLCLYRRNAEGYWLTIAGIKVINSNQKPKKARASYKSFERSFSPVQRKVFW